MGSGLSLAPVALTCSFEFGWTVVATPCLAGSPCRGAETAGCNSDASCLLNAASSALGVHGHGGLVFKDGTTCAEHLEKTGNSECRANFAMLLDMLGEGKVADADARLS